MTIKDQNDDELIHILPYRPEKVELLLTEKKYNLCFGWIKFNKSFVGVFLKTAIWYTSSFFTWESFKPSQSKYTLCYLFVHTRIIFWKLFYYNFKYLDYYPMIRNITMKTKVRVFAIDNGYNIVLERNWKYDLLK